MIIGVIIFIYLIIGGIIAAWFDLDYDDGMILVMIFWPILVIVYVAGEIGYIDLLFLCEKEVEERR